MDTAVGGNMESAYDARRLDRLRGWSPLWSLGDINGDGSDEIVTESDPFLIVYKAATQIDSLIDILIRNPGTVFRDVTPLGDIDGSGRNSVAISYNTAPAIRQPFPGGILFVKPLPSVDDWIGPRKLPHRPGVYCSQTSAVRTEPDVERTTLRVVPNPSSGRMQLRWTVRLQEPLTRVTITDMQGRAIFNEMIAANADTIELPIVDIPSGIYSVTVRNGAATASSMLRIH